MARIADEDRRRLLESRHDISALNNAEELTEDVSLQRALVRSRERLSDTRAALLGAVQHNLQESIETSSARVDLDKSVSAATKQYSFIRGDVEHRLLSDDPDAPRAPDEIEKGEAAFKAVFTQASLRGLGPERLLEVLEEVAEAMIRDPKLAALGLHGRLERAAADLKPRVVLWVREGAEDIEGTTSLRRARAAFDREHGGHALQVRSVLEREGSQHPPGRYLLSEDPAYRGRRRAGRPLNEEPGIEGVDEEAEDQPNP